MRALRGGVRKTPANTNSPKAAASFLTFSAHNWHSRTRRKTPFHIEKVYAFFMNFLSALYEFSNVMEFDHQGKAAMNMICPFSQIEQTAIE
jgi:hypothetical protein